jgi:hypothetical protein
MIAKCKAQGTDHGNEDEHFHNAENVTEVFPEFIFHFIMPPRSPDGMTFVSSPREFFSSERARQIHEVFLSFVLGFVNASMMPIPAIRK